MVGLVIVVVFCLAALLGELVSPYDPQSQNYELLAAPSLAHPLGTDNVGRDLLSRIIVGARISMVVGLSTVALAAAVGIVLGVAAGYYGGWIDMVVMRAIDVLWAFPNFILAVMLVAIFGLGLSNVIVAIALAYVDDFARIIRGMVLVLKEDDFVTAARAMGASNRRMMFKHIFPNALPPVIVQASVFVAAAILAEAGLTFLGLGVSPLTPTWALHPQRRQALLHPRLVARHLPGRRHHARGAGSQLRRRRHPRHQRRSRIRPRRNNITGSGCAPRLSHTPITRNDPRQPWTCLAYNVI